MTKRRDLIRLLEQAGFESKKGTSHEKFTHPDGRTTFVPRYRDIPYSTVQMILKQTGMTGKELKR